MGKTKIKYTNHKDRKQVGKVVEVDAARAKQLIREGLAVEAAQNAKAENKAETKSEPKAK